MRNAILDKLIAALGPALARVPVRQIALGLEEASCCPATSVGGLKQTFSQALTSVVDVGHHAPDAHRFFVEQQTNRRADLTTGVAHPAMGRGTEHVASVDFGIRTRLLNDEDVDAQPQQIVQLGACELGS